jgi:hypothetical protein
MSLAQPSFTLPPRALQHLAARPGGAPLLLVAPHATAPWTAAQPFVQDDPQVQADLAAHIAEWHDAGSGEAMEAAAARLGACGLRPLLPRGVMDLNRGWQGRSEAKETLFGKGALDAWTSARLRPGAREALAVWYRAALAEIQRASDGMRGLIEVHSYGDLGSTYDMRAGGRPVRRAEAAVITATPWATAYPVGLARLLPGDLRGTPWPLERAVTDALAVHGFRAGPSPYPQQGPWALSVRWLAARWFAWLGRSGVLPAATAEHLVALAWTDDQDPHAEAVALGEAAESSGLVGVRALACQMGAWSHEAGQLGDAFLEQDGSFSLVVELRLDRAGDAVRFGEAVAAGLHQYLGA